jgi:DNA-binding NarL/FixJ family response regulator
MARILIVDDEPLITAMMEDWVGAGPCRSWPGAQSGQSADFRAAAFDAAIIDVSLGREDSIRSSTP